MRWMLYVDGASSLKGNEARVILEKSGAIVTELSVKFNLLISNNQAEYMTLIARLQLAADVEATRLTFYSDSHIVTS